MQSGFMHHPEAIVAIALPLTVMICVVTGILCSMRVRQWEMSLKHSMIERGMSAEEIKTVLQASTKKHNGCQVNVHGDQHSVDMSSFL